jgi:hypothetical protein
MRRMMIKVSEIAEALSAIDSALMFVTDSPLDTPGRRILQDRLIKSRVDLEFSLRGIKMLVAQEVEVPQ